MDTLLFLSAPLALGVLLVGIHAYLGFHVLEREVIFIDISLSQVAALGSALSFFFVSGEEDPSLAVVLSLGLCLLVALALSAIKRIERSVSQEAVIGMTYALASGALILVADRLPHGTEHIKEALVGNILYVTWSQVGVTALVYAVIGVIHWSCRRQFWASSRGEDERFTWDFLFYFLFGVVITLSTRHAGVLVVFSILVAPASLASRFSRSEGTRLLIAWLTGVLALALAFWVSFSLDVPAGPAIVCVLTLLFFASLFFRINSNQKEFS